MEYGKLFLGPNFFNKIRNYLIHPGKNAKQFLKYSEKAQNVQKQNSERNESKFMG